MSNKDRWSALSMSERADLINKYVSGGIVDLAEIKRHYNSFGGGGNTKKNKKGFTPIKDLAYKMASDARVSSRGHATVKDIIRILTSSDESQELDDNKMTYIYGNISGLPPAEGSNGKDYSKYLEDKHPIKYWLGKIKEYQGVLNPYNEYVVDERDRGLIEELARKGKGLYSNADTEYSYMADAYDPEVQPYRDDVSSYHMQFVNTPNGPAVSSSDLYDFGPDYDSSKYDIEDGGSRLSRLEAMAMDVVGNPYILRQDNIPIRFISTKDDSLEWEEVERAESLRDAIEHGMLSVKDRQEGVNIDQKIAEVLETGYIEPAVVTAEKKASGGKEHSIEVYKQGGILNRFDDGGEVFDNNSESEQIVKNKPWYTKLLTGDFLPYRKNKKIDFSGIETTGNRKYYPHLIEYINQQIDTMNVDRRATILGDIIEESGGNPFAKSKNGTYQGLLQWGADRYVIPSDQKDTLKAIDEQIKYIIESTQNKNDGKSWTHGGKGSGYNSLSEPYNIFWNNDSSLEDTHRAFSLGYVRPKGKGASEQNRLKVVKKVAEKLK